MSHKEQAARELATAADGFVAALNANHGPGQAVELAAQKARQALDRAEALGVTGEDTRRARQAANHS